MSLYNLSKQNKKKVFVSAYSGYLAYTPHYGEVLIGEHIGNNHYSFYVAPVTAINEDYHTDCKRYAARDFVFKGTLDLNVEDEVFIDDVELIEFIGLDHAVDTKLYIGSPTGQKRTAVYQNGWGTMETANMLRVCKKDAKWYGFAFDNGVFADFKKGLPFNEENFFQKLDALLLEEKYPDFIVIPDIIGGGKGSLHYSVEYLKRLNDCPFPKYLVVQDGMEIQDVEPYLDERLNKERLAFDGIFIGGTPTFKGFGQKQSKEVEWKLQTMEQWNALAHRYGKKCHVGRVSSLRRLNFARSIKVDSCDTSIVNFSPLMFKRYERESKQSIMTF